MNQIVALDLSLSLVRKLDDEEYRRISCGLTELSYQFEFCIFVKEGPPYVVKKDFSFPDVMCHGWENLNDFSGFVVYELCNKMRSDLEKRGLLNNGAQNKR